MTAVTGKKIPLRSGLDLGKGQSAPIFLFFPKYVVTMDELAAGNINGVKIVHLADFLLKEDY